MALAMAAVDAVEATHGIGWPAPVVQMLCGGATWLGAVACVRCAPTLEPVRSARRTW